MNALLNFGKYLYAIPFIVFGFFHFMGAEQMAGMVPIAGGAIWVYVTGVCLIAAGVAMLIGKMDKLAALLLGVLLIVFALSIHSKAAMDGNASQLLKDLAPGRSSLDVRRICSQGQCRCGLNVFVDLRIKGNGLRELAAGDLFDFSPSSVNQNMLAPPKQTEVPINSTRTALRK